MPATRGRPGADRPARAVGARTGAGPRNTRPGQRSALARAQGMAQAARQRPRLTGRAAILVLVLAVLVVSYASSMRAYLQQRSHIAALHAEIVESGTQVSALEREQRRWKDKAYVEAQARERLGWVMPGEYSYQVIGKDGKPLAHADELSRSVPATVPEAWWSTTYSSLQAADHPKKKAASTPATTIRPSDARTDGGR